MLEPVLKTRLHLYVQDLLRALGYSVSLPAAVSLTFSSYFLQLVGRLLLKTSCNPREKKQYGHCVCFV